MRRACDEMVLVLLLKGGMDVCGKGIPSWMDWCDETVSSMLVFVEVELYRAKHHKEF